jgi:Gpi18-like mannosyltransferase
MGGARSEPGSWALPGAWFAVLFLVALLIRLPLVLLPGHGGDVGLTDAWAERIATTGPATFYDNATNVYPAILYVLWPLGIAFQGAPLELVVKGLSIPFDLALGIAIAAITLRFASRGAAFAAAALYLLNPAVLLAGPVWGQYDSAGTLAFILALASTASRRFALAGALGAIAGLLKPQFGLVLLPILVVATADALRERRWQAPLRVLVPALVVTVLIALPLRLDPFRYAGMLASVTNHLPDASLYAMNPWGLLMGFETSEAGFGPVGAVLLVAGLALAVLPLIRRSDLTTLLASGAFVIFAFYFLPTRVHERYLFPAMAVIAPLAVTGLPKLVAYIGLSLAFAAAMLYALVVVTPFGLPDAIEKPLLTPFAVWTMGIALIGYALGWVVMYWRPPWTPRASSAQEAVEPS